MQEWISIRDARLILGWCREGVRRAMLRGDLVGCCHWQPGQRTASLLIDRTTVLQLKAMIDGIEVDDAEQILCAAFRQFERHTRRLTNGCWEWTGRVTTQGYGHVFVKERAYPVHRVAYQVLVGPINLKHHVHHRCRNKACWNPDHLQAVSPSLHQELDQCVGARNRYATHCKHGHEFNEANTYRYIYKGKPHRACKTCKAARKR